MLWNIVFNLVIMFITGVIALSLIGLAIIIGIYLVIMKL